MVRRKKAGHDVHGVLLLDKRRGISSNKALQEAKHLYRANKAGHTGSLDPLATGLLPICFGEATKISGLLLDQDKRYQVIVRLGVSTDTGDAEGSVLESKPVPKLNKDLLNACLNNFTGEISQVPPMYSALKHQGKRLYELARAGRTVERQARRIKIYRLTCPDFTDDCLTLDVSCSKGTYIRSLAEDIGMYFGCGAVVDELRRLEVGQFSLNDAYTIEQLQQMDTQIELMRILRPVDEPLSAWPAIQLLSEQASKIKHGGQVAHSGAGPSGLVRLYYENRFIGIGEAVPDGKLIPKRLFNIN